MTLALKHKTLGLIPYQDSFQAMKDFVATRSTDTIDEIWYVEHPAVFTQGMAGKPEHLHAPGNIPVVQTDRGGQVWPTQLAHGLVSSVVSGRAVAGS